MKRLRLILGDQLNSNHSWFKSKDENTYYCMFELKQEMEYVNHHIQKVVGFFLAMRSFKEELEKSGHTLIYESIDTPCFAWSLEKNLTRLIKELNISLFEYQMPDEYRLDLQLKRFCDSLKISFKAYDTEHFLSTRDEIKTIYGNDKEWVMEKFYRSMRKKHNLLMQEGKPLKNKWNFDNQNRKKWKSNGQSVPYKRFYNEAKDLLKQLNRMQIDTIGKMETSYFDYPINREQSLDLLSFFLENQLPQFGDYQDAMHTEEHFLFHSRLSFSLNLKMISPLEVVTVAESYYHEHSDIIEINQIEGFVRQIIGWREFIRGMYWSQMPTYEKLNFFNHHRPLPSFFWNGNTQMNCLKKAINQSLDSSYAHHIQRLMVIGNFCLLSEIDPNEVDAWYLGVYIDAIQWVQLPNTRGMSQYADGGLLATKPYMSSANYIHKMSNYCQDCKYHPKERTSKNACPFNSLYWNFLLKKKTLLKNNNRMSMMFKLLEKIPEEEIKELQKRANTLMNTLNEL